VFFERAPYLHTKVKKQGGPMNQRDLRYIGVVLIVGGAMLFFDGLGSLILPANYHDFWFDLERVFRIVGSLLLIILGTYFVRETHARTSLHACVV
jgi:hypothetical protein